MNETLQLPAAIRVSKSAWLNNRLLVAGLFPSLFEFPRTTVDNTFSGGVIQPPVVGKFDGNVGIFEGPDISNGIPIIVRLTWTVNPKAPQVATKWEQKLNPKGLPVVAKWEQAFSKDHGKTWETNWYNEFIHDDNCTPTP